MSVTRTTSSVKQAIKDSLEYACASTHTHAQTKTHALKPTHTHTQARACAHTQSPDPGWHESHGDCGLGQTEEPLPTLGPSEPPWAAYGGG